MIRNIHAMTRNGQGRSLTTVVFEGAGDQSAMADSWQKYFQDASQEFHALANSVLDFTKPEIRFGVKDAFFGLEAFPHRARFQSRVFNELQDALFELVLRVS